jgi:hypothetical protein
LRLIVASLRSIDNFDHFVDALVGHTARAI